MTWHSDQGTVKKVINFTVKGFSANGPNLVFPNGKKHFHMKELISQMGEISSFGKLTSPGKTVA